MDAGTSATTVNVSTGTPSWSPVVARLAMPTIVATAAASSSHSSWRRSRSPPRRYRSRRPTTADTNTKPNTPFDAASSAPTGVPLGNASQDIGSWNRGAKPVELLSELNNSTCTGALTAATVATTRPYRPASRPSGKCSSTSGTNRLTAHGQPNEYTVPSSRASEGAALSPIARASQGVTPAVTLWHAPAPSSNQPSRLAGLCQAISSPLAAQAKPTTALGIRKLSRATAKLVPAATTPTIAPHP